MALPSSYTERAFSAFLMREIENFAAIFGWDNIESDGDYQDVVNATLRAYGVTTIDQATNVALLEVLGQREVWRKVVRAAASEYDYAGGGEAFDRAKLFEQANTYLTIAEGAAAAALAQANPDALAATVGSIGVGTLRRRDDPYGVNPGRTGTSGTWGML